MELGGHELAGERKHGQTAQLATRMPVAKKCWRQYSKGYLWSWSIDDNGWLKNDREVGEIDARYGNVAGCDRVHGGGW